MALMEHFSTAEVQANDRIGLWNQIVGQTFRGGAVDAQQDDFLAEFWRWNVGPIRLMRAKSQRSTVTRWKQSRADDADAGRLILHIQNRGASQTTQHARSATLSAGDLTLCDAASPYTLDISDGNDLLVLDVPVSCFDHPDKVTGLITQRLSSGSPHVALLRRFVLSLWDEFGGWVSENEDDTALGRALSELAGLALSPDAIIDVAGTNEDRERIRNWIQERLTDPDLSTSMIANRLNLPVRTIQDIFARMGTTPTQYILRHRLERAHSMLIDHADRSVTDIAFEVGFNDSNYFSRAFKRRFDVTPSMLRARLRKSS
ncbi:helix-turn-helix domain-containing protein [Caballeronia sp. SEWSISQ10-4 2]|uniref:helix-turn-helix domain-containing protein n=1 Tax=Caballeronia sp. SEWSISQ10-4 2 TaxID=2937438 RepID=UPI00264C89F7|nr:helix-turn-helix domain-containing protein [Caballeronia sp. SEWSISQ10-4 2]MDN7179500.1 helix-turn-helix domain-containing protein [Caballeronia sp. SEWSISQ10-4 2]